MKKALSLLAVTILLATAAPLYAQSVVQQANGVQDMPASALSPLSSAWLASAYVSYSSRDGYRKYDGVDGYQRLRNSGISLFGGAAGKRFALRDPRLRIQAVAEVGWGSVKEGPIYLQEKGSGNPIECDLYSNFLIGVIQGEIHYLFPSVSNRNYFLSAGPGAHVSSFHETAKLGNETVLEDSTRLFTASLNFNIGVGMEEYRFSKNWAVSICYNLRLWEPLHIIETGELFPMGVDYREFFYTHMLSVQVLLLGSKR
jgi:hypothetical protein